MSQTNIYRIAEHNISITSHYDQVHKYCKDYLINDDLSDDLCIQIITSQEDIDIERQRSEQEDILEGKPIHKWSDAYLEEMAVYRILAEKMPEYNTFLVHGSAVSVGGEAYLFTAKSGVGKSTHVRLWQDLFKEMALVVNDDKPLIRIEEDKAVIYGTPYNGKHGSGNNISAPLKAICFLGRAEDNYIEQIPKKDAFPLLLQQVYRSEDPEVMGKIIELVAKLTGFVNFWKMGCNMDISAARMAYTAMSESETPQE